MRRIGAFAMALTLAGSLTTGALAVDKMPISAPVNYQTAITVNGTKLDTASLPAASGIPMRLVAESDYGSASWFQDENMSAFYMDNLYITVDFKTNAVSVNEKPLDGVTAQVIGGITFLPTTVFDGLEGYTLKTEDGTVDLTTPNSDPLVKLGYEVVEVSNMSRGSKTTAAQMEEFHKIKAEWFSEVIGFFPMMVSADTLIVGKLADGVKEADVKAALDAYVAAQKETFSWYLPQNLEKIEAAQMVFENGYVFFLIAEDSAAGLKVFQDWQKAQ